MNLQNINWASDIVNKIRKLNYRDLIIFLIPFVIFLYYLSVFNPGILTTDSYMQLHQIATGTFDSWHPFFHTFIEMLCINIFPSTASVGVFQIFIFSSIWMLICKYNSNETDTNVNKLFILHLNYIIIILSVIFIIN